MKPSTKTSKNFLEWIKQLWAPFAGFLGAIILIGNFIELWKGNQATYTLIAAILGFLVLVFALSWIGFRQVDSEERLLLPSRKNIFHPQYPSLYKLARFSLATTILLALFGTYFIIQQSKT